MTQYPPKRFYEFDQFRIDLEERRLTHASVPVALTPKVFDILLALVENSGHTLQKETLMERVWADSFVEEGNLNRNVSTLRKALGEDAHGQHFIKTVPKRGYRFEGDVREVVEDDESFTVERQTNYRISLRETTETRTAVSRRLIAAFGIAVLLVGGVGWLATRGTGTEANAVVVAKTEKRGTASDEAFELYQTGRALWQNRSVEGLHQATFDLERAVWIDPEFALARAALADAYAFDVFNWKKAEAAANEAIRLDPGLGQPHATIGFLRTFWEWKLAEAVPHFKEAIKLSPDYATAHQWYAINLAARTVGGSSLAEMNRALELEPASLAINADMCQLLYFARKYDQAIEQCRRTLEMDPKFIPAYQYLYSVYTASERYPEAVDAFFASEELSMTTRTLPDEVAKLRAAYQTGGIRAFWRERIAMLAKLNPPAAYDLAQYHTRLGDHEAALKWFQHSAAAREFPFLFFATDHVNQHLFSDPRYKELAANLLGETRF